MDSFPNPKVRFLGEHDGVPEREFKRRVLRVLEVSKTAEAYLAEVSYEGAEGPIVAVCLVGDSGEAAKVCTNIAEIYTSVFRDMIPLDMMYLTRDQRTDLARVCMPFYLHRDHAQA